MQKFYDENRLHLIFGNHDFVYKNPNVVKRLLSEYFYPKEGKNIPLFPNIKFHEGIVLEHQEMNQELFLTHGHQADFMNYVD
jgi:hypothetical protein